MANIAQFATSSMLNWVLSSTGAAPTRPAACAVGLSLGSPTSTSGSEIPNTSGYSTRQSGQFAAATTVASSAYASNTVAMSWANMSAASISGLQIWDTLLSNNSGNMLWYGLLAAPRTLSAGDALVIASGALTCSLN